MIPSKIVIESRELRAGKVPGALCFSQRKEVVTAFQKAGAWPLLSDNRLLLRLAPRL
jgi:hypothetical protein